MESRQVRRANERAAAKADRHREIAIGRKEAARELLARQTSREKAGAYAGRASVASAKSQSRSRITARKVKKGQLNGRILFTLAGDRREVRLHATKGWRSFAV